MLVNFFHYNFKMLRILKIIHAKYKNQQIVNH